jgi:hypothetical protein
MWRLFQFELENCHMSCCWAVCVTLRAVRSARNLLVINFAITSTSNKCTWIIYHALLCSLCSLLQRIALCWALTACSVSWSYTQPVGFLGRGISPSQGRNLRTEQHGHRINAHRHPCLERNSNPPSKRSSERRDLCLRSRGHCDRNIFI